MRGHEASNLRLRNPSCSNNHYPRVPRNSARTSSFWGLWTGGRDCLWFQPSHLRLRVYSRPHTAREASIHAHIDLIWLQNPHYHHHHPIDKTAHRLDGLRPATTVREPKPIDPTPRFDLLPHPARSRPSRCGSMRARTYA